MKKNLLLFGVFSLILSSCSTKVAKMNSIPIRYDGYLHFDVQVENKVYGNFVFDTGAPVIILDSLFCKKSGFDFETKDVLVGGIGNATRTAQMITDTIHYEFSKKDNHYNSNLALILNLKSMIGEKIDGIAGIQTFAERRYMIDYVTQHITFINSVKGFEEVNAKFEENKIFLPLTIKLKNNKTINGNFLLDTGSDQTTLNSHVFMTDGIYNDINKKKFYAKGGVGGDSNGYFLPIEEVDLGKFKLKKLIMTISTDSLGMLENPNYMGIIGNDLLDDFSIILDHQKEKIWVKPNKNFDKNKRKYFRSISFKDIGEKWLVTGIVEISEAFQRGIRINDQIIEINSVSVEKINIKDFVDKLKENDTLLLKIKQGNEVKEISFKLDIFIKS